MPNQQNKKSLAICQIFIGILLSYCTLTYSSQPRTAPNTLAEFVHSVIDRNPAVCAARANVRAYNARYVANSMPIYNPEFTAEAQQALENTYNVGINQTIDITNKRLSRSRIGAADFCAAKMQLALLEQQLTADLLNALITFHTQSEVVYFAQERKRILERFFTLTKKLHDSGDVTRVDVDLSQLAFSESIALAAQSEVKLNEAMQALRAIVGCENTFWPCFPEKPPCIQVTDQQIDCLLQSLPGYHVLVSQAQSAKAKIKLAQKQSVPDPTIGVQGGYQEGVEGKDSLVGLTLSVPLYVRNPYRAEISAASADYSEADQKRRDWLRVTRAELKGTAERYNILNTAFNQWEKYSSRPLKDGIVLIEKLWQAGEITTTDYLVQLRQRVDNQITGAELKSQTWQAFINWLKVSNQSEHWLGIVT